MSEQSLTDAIIRELAGLSEERQEDVVAFVRFLKIGLADMEAASQQFDDALLQARKIAEDNKITTEDIDAEIRAYRTKK
jgi:hypothetical protein